MKMLQIELPDKLADELENAVKAGTFLNAGDAVRSALRLKQPHRAKDESEIAILSPNDARLVGYQHRARMLEDAWKKSSLSQILPALTFASLVATMKESSRSNAPSTSMYFAGADVDHPYFLKSDALAIGIAVLPEDAEKAKARKRHPHQVEVIFVLEGGLNLYIEGSAPITLRKSDYYVIGKNVCHWVTPLEEQPGVFLFVKTNPAQEPRGVSCG